MRVISSQTTMKVNKMKKYTRNVSIYTKLVSKNQRKIPSHKKFKSLSISANLA